MDSQMPPISTRRQLLIGGASVVITSGMSGRATGFIVPWAGRIAAGVASGLLIEALKRWGLMPEARANTATVVHNHHQQNLVVLQQQGYRVRPMYSGGSAAGDFMLSEATQADDFLALGTTRHGSNTCTLRFDKADIANLALVSGALRQKGFDSNAVETAGHPIHPPADNRLVGNERFSPNYMTPSHGTIAWKTNVNNPRPNLVTAVRSRIVNTNLHFAQLDNERWTFEMRPPVDLRYA